MTRRPYTLIKLAPVGGLVLVLALALATPSRAQTMTNTFGGLSESSDQPIDIESDVLYVYDAKKYATFKGDVKAVQGTTTLRASELDVHYVGGSEKLTGGEAKPVANTTRTQSTETTAATPAATGVAPAPPQGAAPAAANAAAKGKPETQINKIEARGNVVITSEDDQTTTSDWALYDVPAQLVTVGGNVVLTQGDNVLKGDRLIIDLKTGESRFENTGNATAGGRIRALFMPKGSGTGSPNEDQEDGKPKKPKKRKSGQGDDKPGEAASASDRPEGKKGKRDGPMPIVPEYR
ncbi:MAG: LptA/OstA family protein [Methyloceanibacter sp.]